MSARSSSHGVGSPSSHARERGRMAARRFPKKIRGTVLSSQGLPWARTYVKHVPEKDLRWYFERRRDGWNSERISARMEIVDPEEYTSSWKSTAEEEYVVSEEYKETKEYMMSEDYTSCYTSTVEATEEAHTKEVVEEAEHMPEEVVEAELSFAESAEHLRAGWAEISLWRRRRRRRRRKHRSRRRSRALGTEEPNRLSVGQASG